MLLPLAAYFAERRKPNTTEMQFGWGFVVSCLLAYIKTELIASTYKRNEPFCKSVLPLLPPLNE